MDFDWPFRVSTIEWGIQKAGVQFTGPYNGTLQAVEFAAERWLVSVNLPPVVTADAGAVEAFFERMAGGVNRVRIWHMARPVPLGTMRGTPTIAVSAARGDLQLRITTAANATLKAGDMVSAGGQLFKVAEDCQATIGGLLTAPVTTRVRALISAGAAVAWDKPTAFFAMPTQSVRFAHSVGILGEVAIELQEVW